MHQNQNWASGQQKPEKDRSVEQNFLRNNALLLGAC